MRVFPATVFLVFAIFGAIIAPNAALSAYVLRVTGMLNGSESVILHVNKIDSFSIKQDILRTYAAEVLNTNSVECYTVITENIKVGSNGAIVKAKFNSTEKNVHVFGRIVDLPECFSDADRIIINFGWKLTRREKDLVRGGRPISQVGPPVVSSGFIINADGSTATKPAQIERLSWSWRSP